MEITLSKCPWRIRITSFEVLNINTSLPALSLVCEITNNNKNELEEFIKNSTSPDGKFYLSEYTVIKYQKIEYYINRVSLELNETELQIEIMVEPLYIEIKSHDADNERVPPGEDAFWRAHHSGDYNDMGGY
jgi:hypothetical protein